MKTLTEDIDVVKAKAYLQKNKDFESGVADTNRPTSNNHINNMALDMLRGHWRLTHQGIGFDTNAVLKDGQQRLMALVQAAEFGATDGDNIFPPKPKIKIKMNVTYGLEPDVFDVLDIGRTRHSSQILAMAGYVNTMQLGASARLLYLYDHHGEGSWRSVKVTNHQVLEYVKTTNLEEAIARTAGLRKIGFIITSVSVGLFVTERAYPDTELTEAFINALKTGEGYRTQDPARALREYVIRSRGTRNARRDSFYQLAIYIKTWNDYVSGRRKVVVPIWKNGEPFPQPIEKT